MFDPSLPTTGSPLESAVMRSQFNGLKALIDAINAINAAQVDGVTTVPPTDPATVQVSVAGGTLHFTFAIPMGQTGPQGQPGQNGGDGSPGPTGPQGPPGEVTQAALDTALATTARNPNSLGPPGFSFSNPPTDTELYALQSWLVDFYNALYRTP